MAKRNRSSDGKTGRKKHLQQQQEFTGTIDGIHRSGCRELAVSRSSMQALQWRGAQFLSCHTALEEQARILVRRNQLPQSPEEVVEDMLAHAEPGILVVAGMAAALALLQAQGHYTYVSG